ncbi:MAG: hypothetical protein JWP89_2749 [Schlesneria sp.]|nr:hypothetical protein [Schlesneria sp.]
MASISTDSEGLRRILFVSGEGKRKAIRLGRVSMKLAESFLTRVESMASALMLRQPFDRDLSLWLAGLADKQFEKLVKAGLVQPRNQKTNAVPVGPTLGEFIDQYTAGRKDVKPGTQTNYRICRQKLVAFFGESRPLSAITALDADRFRSGCKGDKLSENYTRTLVKNAKLIFGAAVKGKVISENPFAGHKTTVYSRPERMEFIDLESSRKVLAACPSAEWKAIFSLCRFGGLRCPSEVLALRWDSIDWDRGRVLIRSPKTEHHEGGEYRTIPLFPELRDALSELDLATPDGGDFVIRPKARGAHSNLRTTFAKIIAKAGVKPWGKPFQNLRSSRETELMQSHPIHVVTAWLGNTPKVALESYLQVRDSDFDLAAGTQKTAQHAPVTTGGDSLIASPEMKNPLFPVGTQGAANARDQFSCPERIRTFTK